MAQLRRPGAVVHHTEDGPHGAPVIVFGHGLLMTSEMFHHQVEALRHEFRCVRLDWRGHGLSTARRQFTLDDLADDLEALMDLVGEPVHYVGHSLGAYTVIPLAAARPALFRSLTLISAAARAEHPDVAVEYHRLATRYRRTGKLFVARRVKELLFSASTLASPAHRADLQLWEEEAEFPSRVEVRRAVRATANRYGVQCETALLTMPVQLITGTEDFANPPERARRIQELCPGTPLHLLPEVGHVPPLEAPDQVTRLTRSFVRACERRPGSLMPLPWHRR